MMMMYKKCANCVFVLVVLLAGGCVSNIENFHSDVICPVDYVFAAPFDQTWDATVKAVLQLGTADEIDQTKGIIISGMNIVAGSDPTKIEIAVFGQVYKYSFKIKLYPEDNGKKTHIITQVNLVYEQFIGMKQYEDRKSELENYLRDKLYRKICGNLFTDGNAPCSKGFENYTTREPEESPAPPVARKNKPRFDSRVQFAQDILGQNGYTPGLADGLMGRKTKMALSEFQQDQGITVTAAINDETWDALQMFESKSGVDLLPGKLTVPPANQMKEDSPTTNKPSVEKTVVKPHSLNKTSNKGKISQESRGDNEKKATGSKAQTQGYAVSPSVVTIETADLLQEADLFGAEIITIIPPHTALQVLSSDGEYFKVKYRGKEGYVYFESVESEQIK